MDAGNDQEIGLDSQCLSYVIDGLEGVEAPKDALASIRIALARLFFYTPGTLWVTPTVEVECARIRRIDRRILHERWIAPLFGVRPPLDPQRVIERTAELLRLHPDEDDCRIVAEAEGAELRVLLTNDDKLLKHLTGATTLGIHRPEELWTALAIPPGAKPNKIPAFDNPLSGQTWWQWTKP